MKQLYNAKFILIVVMSSILASLSTNLREQALAETSTVSNTIDRSLDPVIVTGADVPFLNGAAISLIYVYIYSGGSWVGPIPFQIDEVSVDGDYVLVEDGILDANDEIVFMASDLGEKSPLSAETMILPSIGITIEEIEVTDPLNPTNQGWAYIVRSLNDPTLSSIDYVDYNVATRLITAQDYELGFPTTYAGSDRLFLNGSGVDILDRLKLRIVGDASNLVTQTATENLFSTPEFDPILIKDGPIRVVIQQTLRALGSTLDSTYFAYAGMLQSVSDLTFPDPATLDITVTSLRTTFDFNSLAVGSTFYNANVPSGIAVDGNPDVGADTLLSHWFQLSHSTGRFIYVADSSPIGSIPNTYYKDDSTIDSLDTGDQRVYGEAGYIVTGGVNLSSILNTSYYVLPPVGSGPTPDNLGALHEQYYFNPLAINSTLIGRQDLYLPIIVNYYQNPPFVIP